MYSADLLDSVIVSGTASREMQVRRLLPVDASKKLSCLCQKVSSSKPSLLSARLLLCCWVGRCSQVPLLPACHSPPICTERHKHVRTSYYTSVHAMDFITGQTEMMNACGVMQSGTATVRDSLEACKYQAPSGKRNTEFSSMQ